MELVPWRGSAGRCLLVLVPCRGSPGRVTWWMPSGMSHGGVPWSGSHGGVLPRGFPGPGPLEGYSGAVPSRGSPVGTPGGQLWVTYRGPCGESTRRVPLDRVNWRGSPESVPCRGSRGWGPLFAPWRGCLDRVHCRVYPGGGSLEGSPVWDTQDGVSCWGSHWVVHLRGPLEGSPGRGPMEVVPWWGPL